MRGSGGFVGLWCSGWRARWSVGVPDGLSAGGCAGRCRATAVVTNAGSDSVSTSDVKTRTKHPTDIEVGEAPGVLAITPCRR